MNKRMDSSIETTLAAQIDSLVKQLEEERKKTRYLEKELNRDRIYSFPFKVLSKTPLVVAGVALGAGVWNGVTYQAEEIKKAYELIKDKELEIDVEHGRDPEFGDKVVGVAKKWEWSDSLKCILLSKAEILDSKAQELILRGELKGFSFAVYPDIEWDEKVRVAKNFDLKRISLTRYPAVDFAFITNVEQLLSKMELSEEAKKETSQGQEVKEEAKVEVQKQETQKEESQKEEKKAKAEAIEAVSKVKDLEAVVKELITRFEASQTEVRTNLQKLEEKLKNLEEVSKPKEIIQEKVETPPKESIPEESLEQYSVGELFALEGEKKRLAYKSRSKSAGNQ